VSEVALNRTRRAARRGLRAPRHRPTVFPNLWSAKGGVSLRGVYLFIYLFLINACNLKVMARFTELNT
jgi:hypothetical protein